MIALRTLPVLFVLLLAPFGSVVSAAASASASASASAWASRQGVAGVAGPAPAASAAEQAPRARALPPLQAPVTVAVPFRPPSTRFAAGHRGVDLSAESGAEVSSPADGIVTFAGDVAGRGVVVVRHGDLRSTLEPVVPAVSAGDTVLAGALVGFLASGHERCLPGICLHWGVRVNQEYVDPMLLLMSKPRIRLLPWDP